MKLTIYSFKTYEDFQTLKGEFNHLGYDVMYNIYGAYVRHSEEAVKYFTSITEGVSTQEILCNNGDMVNYMLGWCEDNGWDAEVVYCSEGKIDTAPMVDGFLTN